MTDEQHDPEGSVETPVVRDRRRIDPETGERRSPDEESVPVVDSAAPAEEGLAAAGTEPEGSDEELAQARAQAAERLDDLKRLQAEYVNYRRRVERDRETVRETAKAEVLSGLLDVLDDIGRAREHGDLTGAFRAVGEALEAAVTKAGLEQYGEVGDEFDPTIHEALMHGYDDEVDVVTCTQILQPGYRVGERIIRAARVAVAEPTEALPAQQDGGDDGGTVVAGEPVEGAEEEK
ncbi:nucleotide exchange factor GrpE [Phytoactinopolyspora endophytica]|uniref:nucleotide exchange factor GrpE n=1 Tax=Phytoactinopolyspora endophytica TaxID=1642495 RepID=UPI00101DBB83|nr:nucleotide exchange factor GrpE [Phytoactinopolyspora endophytica]